jgi:hypothetical protein
MFTAWIVKHLKCRQPELQVSQFEFRQVNLPNRYETLVLLELASSNISYEMFSKAKLRGFSPQANYIYRANAACWRS